MAEETADNATTPQPEPQDNAGADLNRFKDIANNANKKSLIFKEITRALKNFAVSEHRDLSGGILYEPTKALQALDSSKLLTIITNKTVDAVVLAMIAKHKQANDEVISAILQLENVVDDVVLLEILKNQAEITEDNLTKIARHPDCSSPHLPYIATKTAKEGTLKNVLFKIEAIISLPNNTSTALQDCASALAAVSHNPAINCNDEIQPLLTKVFAKTYKADDDIFCQLIKVKNIQAKLLLDIVDRTNHHATLQQVLVATAAIASLYDKGQILAAIAVKNCTSTELQKVVVSAQTQFKVVATQFFHDQKTCPVVRAVEPTTQADANDAGAKALAAEDLDAKKAMTPAEHMLILLKQVNKATTGKH